MQLKNNYNLDDYYRDFLELVGERFSETEIKVIQEAYLFASQVHQNQKRLTGEPYIVHGLATAGILIKWKLDLTSVVAGILHDVIEDGNVSRIQIEEKFGADVAGIVAGVTKISLLKLKGSVQEEFVENLRKMFLAMAKDLRVILVKLADRLHNLRTLYALPRDKQVRIATQTIEIYAPLAERLGMGEIKGELEDLSFPYLYLQQYKRLRQESKKYYQKAEVDIQKMKYKIQTELKTAGISAQTNSRKKHLYSLWKKLEREDIVWNFEKIHDIVAIRIIVKGIADCYSALGIVHGLFKPVPVIPISDFIAQPKPNGYRSIHTRVFGIKGRIVEIQIRTAQMHEEAEYGIAAHWAYSLVKSSGKSSKFLDQGRVNTYSDKLAWIKQLADWQKELRNSQDFLDAVKFDALGHRIYVFSPQGDVFDLPAGATCVDFAYAVHTQLGNYISSAKVNAKIVPLNQVLKSGDVVEIIKFKNSKIPNKHWLEFVKTNLAKKEIFKKTKTA